MNPTTTLVNFYKEGASFKWHRDSEDPEVQRTNRAPAHRLVHRRFIVRIRVQATIRGCESRRRATRQRRRVAVRGTREDDRAFGVEGVAADHAAGASREDAPRKTQRHRERHRKRRHRRQRVSSLSRPIRRRTRGRPGVGRGRAEDELAYYSRVPSSIGEREAYSSPLGVDGFDARAEGLVPLETRRAVRRRPLIASRTDGGAPRRPPRRPRTRRTGRRFESRPRRRVRARDLSGASPTS